MLTTEQIVTLSVASRAANALNGVAAPLAAVGLVRARHRPIDSRGAPWRRIAHNRKHGAVVSIQVATEHPGSCRSNDIWIWISDRVPSIAGGGHNKGLTPRMSWEGW
jgi:hypothetical protein